MPKDEAKLRESLTDPNSKFIEKKQILKLLSLNNFYQHIVLLAFCLMPNHFHFFIKQKEEKDLDKFMNSIWTRYAMYFNRKYNRVGPLFQGVYKAVLVTKEEYFIYLSKYIHKQALTRQGEALVERYPSSFGDYIGERRTEWVHPEEVLIYFNQKHPEKSYQAFIRDNDIIDLPDELKLED